MTGYPRARTSPKRRVSAYAAAPHRRVPYTRTLYAAVPRPRRATQMRNHLLNLTNYVNKTTINTTATLDNQRGHHWDSSQTVNTPNNNDLTFSGGGDGHVVLLRQVVTAPAGV